MNTIVLFFFYEKVIYFIQKKHTRVHIEMTTRTHTRVTQNINSEMNEQSPSTKAHIKAAT